MTKFVRHVRALNLQIFTEVRILVINVNNVMGRANNEQKIF